MGCTLVYCAMFGIGEFVLQAWLAGFVLFAGAAIAGYSDLLESFAARLGNPLGRNVGSTGHGPRRSDHCGRVTRIFSSRSRPQNKKEAEKILRSALCSVAA